MHEGAQVTLLARDEGRLASARDALERQFARKVEIELCDLEHPARFETSIARISSRSGRVDLLVNNAGIIRRSAADQVPMADWERAMSVHFWSPLYGMRAVIPVMRSQGGGRIINISSIEGRVSFPRIAPYCASKFALLGCRIVSGQSSLRNVFG
jgi:NAD(P)-dependent dehydrogenase (short-subunit alcohol dehydrogenase family)